MTEVKPEDEFDTSDLDVTPPEGRQVDTAIPSEPQPVDRLLDHAALLEQGKSIAKLEAHVRLLEGMIDAQGRDNQNLRKLLQVWINGH